MPLAQQSLPMFQAQCIWSKGKHHAFTDLAYFKGAFWCAFRDATDHVSADGVIRLLYSADEGRTWMSVQVFEAKGDLRDPSLIITPDERLLLLAACKGDRKAQGFSHQMLVWEAQFTQAKIAWLKPKSIGEKDLWLWRVGFYSQKKGLGIAYKVGGDPHTRLYQVDTNLNHQTLQERFRSATNSQGVIYQAKEYSNESGLCFEQQGRAWCLLRRDPEQALLGYADPPYQQWQWLETGERIGGPALVLLNDQRLLAVVRLYGYENNELVSARTSLAWLCKETGRLIECGLLPSGGDTSYAGLVVKNDTVFISYYASHEGSTNIYFAQVPISELAANHAVGT